MNANSYLIIDLKSLDQLDKAYMTEMEELEAALQNYKNNLLREQQRVCDLLFVFGIVDLQIVIHFKLIYLDMQQQNRRALLSIR